MMRLTTFAPLWLSLLLSLYVACCASCNDTVAEEVAVVFEPSDFAPWTITPQQRQGFNLIVPGALERTPRDYTKVAARLQTTGRSSVQIAMVDILDREYCGPVVRLAPARETEVAVDLSAVGHPLSMLRTVRLYAEGSPVRIVNLRIYCAAEKLPTPDVVVKGPLDETSIQAALDSLGEAGGVVHIPAGTYMINNTVTVPRDNVTIYGDGAATVFKATWYSAKPMLLLAGRKNVRITRLRFQGWPETAFRGYNEAQYAAKPEDAGRADNVMTRAVDINDCDNVRFDHSTVELCGHTGLLIKGEGLVLVDHCFFQKNFRYGYGYGVVPHATKACYIEDTNFENHRHGVAGSSNSMASYICRFNRFVKDVKAVPEEGWKQVTSHEIDVHHGCGWLYAHDNYVEMKNAMMSSGVCLRGNSGWVYRHLLVNCNIGVYVVGASDDIWTWDNTCRDVPTPQLSKATGSIHFDQKPDNFAEIPYPNELNRLAWWPGAEDGSATILHPETQFAGPEDAQVLRLAADK